MNEHNVGVYSMNVRGLGNSFKRNQVFLWLKNHPGSIYFLQETHSTIDSEKVWNDEWGDDIYFSHGTSNSKGVCILMKNINFDFVKSFNDIEGRILILDIILQGQKFTMANIYGYNYDNPGFFEDVERNLQDFVCESIIIGDDFNIILDVLKDKKGGSRFSKPNAQRQVKSMMESFDLVDIWRDQHPNLMQFTWRSYNPPVQSRLDFFLISFNLYAQVDKSEISSGFKTDHSLVKFHVVPVNEARGRGFWKFNTALLHEPEYVDKIKKCISEVKINVNSMDPSMLWEFMKCKVRSVTIEFAAKLSKCRKIYESELSTKLNELEMRFSVDPCDNIAKEIQECKMNIEALYSYKTKGCIIRSRAKNVEFGEKNSRFFINLEKRNHRQRVITKLVTDDDNVLTDGNDILNEEKSFYKTLYTSCNPTECNIVEDFFPPGTVYPKLDHAQKLTCEGLITLQECLTVLKAMPNNKTPGTDGIPTDWYKFFFKDVGQTVVDSFNYAFKHGKLSPDQRRGIINLIPKKDKNPTYLKNWRPISLLNTDYKLASKCIASRIKNVLHNIISGEQTGFLKGRYIGENIRLALDMIDYLSNNNLPGLMFLIDFEKAFDKLEWSFIFKAMKLFNFGDDVINWVRVFYNDILSCVINNGNVSSFFNLFCGVRQGCPLSPYLYIICGEILSIAIRNDSNIKGIDILDSNVKINSYADDTTLYVPDVVSLQCAIKVISKFREFSGLKINMSKSEILPLGSFKLNLPDISSLKISFSSGPVRYLGVLLSTSPCQIFELNFVPKLQKLKDILRIWSCRDLSPLGKIAVIKSLGLSQLIFLFSVLPDPPAQFTKELESIVFKFIWSGKPDKVKRLTIIGDYAEGGLRMCHIPSLLNGLKIAWVKRLIDGNNTGYWKIFFNYYLKPFGGNILWYCNMNKTEKCIDNIKNEFVKNVVQSWCSLAYDSDTANVKDQIIWNNSLIKIDKKTQFKQHWYNNGVKYVKDLTSDNGIFFKFNEFIAKYPGLRSNFMEYFSLIHATPTTWRKKNSTTDRQNNLNWQEDLVNEIRRTGKVCKLIQKMCVDQIFKPPVGEEKWAIQFNDANLDWTAIYRIPFGCTLSTKLRYFQFQFLLRYLPLNKFLFDIGIIKSKLCSFCKIHDETSVHLFWECSITKSFWHEIHKNLLNNFFRITDKIVYFGILDPSQGHLNFIILHAKYYVYCCRCNNTMPNIHHFKSKMKLNCAVEKQIALGRDNLSVWEKKWDFLKI